ncbi:DnaJ domain-containing protein [Consotaella aegiceratis]|uniref:DnaJ domain-containing protein n=1 Tax=Consotaella aegiceratis TaxID=3097961 RepID=UPI002F421051
MIYLLSAAAFAVVVISLIRILLNTPAETLARWLRRAGPIALIAIGGVLALIGRAAIGLPLAGLGLAALRRSRFGAAGGATSSARTSSVRSAYLAMTLDHDTGEIEGEVLSGPFQGRPLASLNEADLRKLLGEVAADADSVRLLEAYLDRRLSGWRERFDANAGDGLGSAPGAGAMTQEQAYQILGLQPGATLAEIREAHRRLMKRVHPDHGGTDFLAARINEAKALLIDRHR